MNSAITVVMLCASAIMWIIIGYPLYLALRAAGVRSTPALTPYLPTLSVIVPVYNGGRFLEAKLRSLLASNYPMNGSEILVVSDGSTDETESIAERYTRIAPVRLLRVPRGGKAAALSAAFAEARGEVFVLTDVRQSFEPDAIRCLVGYLSDPEVGAVSGALRIRSGETHGEASVGLYWRYESWIRRNLSRRDSLIGATGAIYAIRRALVRPIPRGCLLDDVFLPSQVVLAGLRVVQASDAIAWDYATSLDVEFGRKVRTQAGIYQLLALEPRLLDPRAHRLWWPFVNLKLGRLLMPHLLLGVFVASFWLQRPYAVDFVLLQVAFYSLYWLDRFVPEASALKRVTAAVNAFVTLVAAAFVAQSILFREPHDLWISSRVREGAT